MKLLQFRTETGKLRGGLIEGAYVRHISAPVARLVSLAGRAGMPADALREMCMPEDRRVTYQELEQQGKLALPIQPAEVWGAGGTYRPIAEGASAADQGLAGRPELFFKATASRCAGPNEPIGIREDSPVNLPEPELAVVIGDEGRILAYTLANDVSAWSIRQEGSRYQPQSKIFRGCCALGPVLVTVDEIPDPRELELRCRILRGEKCVFEGAAALSRMRRTVPELIDWLLRCNEIPDGTVLLTGSGLAVPPEAALAQGDVVEMSCDAIGTLRNHCRIVRASTLRGQAV